MPKDKEIVTVSVLREMFSENNAILMRRMDGMEERMGTGFARMDAEFALMYAKFDQIDTRFEEVKTEFARVHREISDLRDDVVEIIDNSIVPQLEEHRRDISLLKRAVTTA